MLDQAINICIFGKSFSKQKLRRELHLKGKLRKQPNKYQNLQKTILKTEQNKKLPITCLRQLAA